MASTNPPSDFDVDNSAFNSPADYVIIEDIPELADKVIVIIFITLSVVALAINFALLAIILKTKVLRRCTNVFIVSLAVSEIVNGIFKMLFAAAARMMPADKNMDEFCNFSCFFSSTGRISATLVLMIICIDRCLAVSKPLKYSRIMTKCTTGMTLSAAWVTAIFFSGFPILNKAGYVYNNHYKLCQHDFAKNRLFIKFYVTLSTVVPMTVITLCLLLILKEARMRHRIFDAASLTLSFTSSSSNNMHFRKTILKAMRSLVFIVGAYSLFCIPESLFMLLRIENNRQFSCSLVLILDILSCLFSVVTPSMITLFNKNYQYRLREIYCCACAVRQTKLTNISQTYSVNNALQNVLELPMLINKLERGSKTSRISKS